MTDTSRTGPCFTPGTLHDDVTAFIWLQTFSKVTLSLKIIHILHSNINIRVQFILSSPFFHVSARVTSPW